MGDVRPYWQIDDCPAWCDRDHRDGDRGDDRSHTSAALVVPAVRRRTRTVQGRAVHVLDAVELVIVLARDDGDVDTWVHIGDDGDDPLEISAESARRLLPRLVATLVALDR